MSLKLKVSQINRQEHDTESYTLITKAQAPGKFFPLYSSCFSFLQWKPNPVWWQAINKSKPVIWDHENILLRGRLPGPRLYFLFLSINSRLVVSCVMMPAVLQTKASPFFFLSAVCVLMRLILSFPMKHFSPIMASIYCFYCSNILQKKKAEDKDESVESRMQCS